MNEILKKVGITRELPQWASNYCYEHIPGYVLPEEPTEAEISAAQEKFRVQMMLVEGNEVCPRCACDNETKRLEDEASERYKRSSEHEKYNTLEKQSVFQDETIMDATFENYVLDANQHEARVHLQKVLQALEEYKQGRQFNLWLVGNVGVGKSHLSMSVLKELRSLSTSCVFIDVDEMFRRMFHAMYKDQESPYTEAYFIELATKVDFLILDDLGAETGNINTDKGASDFKSRVLRAIVNGRQNKSTIFTTNLTSKQIISMYDAKLADRMLKNARAINYVDTLSYRTKNNMF
ncbi:ATP-binding protein [Solibacillus isronensis]